MDIVCIGEMVIDFIPGNEENTFIQKAGGAPANVAIGVARHGFKSAWCGTVGEDQFGKFLHETLNENQVNILVENRIKEAITTMAFVHLHEGERSFTFARKPGADMFLTEEDIDKANIEASKIVHAGSCSLSAQPAADATIYALQKGQAAGCLVSFDLNYRNLMWNDDIEAAKSYIDQALEYVDIMKISDEEYQLFWSGMNLEDIRKQYELQLIVLTCGADPTLACYQGGIVEVPVPIIDSKKIIDTTGAGDAFWSGFLAHLIANEVKKDFRKEFLEKAIKIGNVAGTLCVQKKGAIESLPSAKEVSQLYKEFYHD